MRTVIRIGGVRHFGGLARCATKEEIRFGWIKDGRLREDEKAETILSGNYLYARKGIFIYT
jgi:hypothetical protein